MLGASNLVRCLPTIVNTTRRVWGQPLDFIAALGHGRSYGMDSRVLGRTLPGITHCALWQEVAQRPEARTAALITDVGNDILYGVSSDQIAEWVDQCCTRLTPMCEAIVVTQLPLRALERLGRVRFYALRTVLFPFSRLRFEGLMSTATDLNEALVTVARRHRAHVIEPDPGWYGFDPIHIRRRQAGEAWSRILSSWSRPTRDEGNDNARRLAWKLIRLRPHRRRLFGIEQRQFQPALQLEDGTEISLY